MDHKSSRESKAHAVFVRKNKFSLFTHELLKLSIKAQTSVGSVSVSPVCILGAIFSD